ncbi:MAG: HDOD domain-containing protein [Spirochaetales bacterium]|nr:HDOD domain-containing protein [Spirochaetales bacterium]
MAKIVDVAQINKAFVASVPVTIKTFTLPHETENYIEDVLGVYLNKFGQGELKDRIGYCMRELAVNAKKANTKRVYFSEKNLDINNSDDYAEGMKTFKQETLDNINYWLEKQKDAGLYIKVVFHSKNNSFSMAIKNNVLISQKEQMRVYDRIARSRAFESMEEALTSVLDDSEGAGLGIVILVLMLKKIGLDEDAFDIDVIDNETVATITIPFDKLHLENLDLLSKEIVEEIEDLPQFPENVVFIQKLINDPESELTDIARQISMDPSLTADLLKVVNSAQFMLPKKVDNIVEAVKLVGLRGISNMLFSYGTQKVLKTDQRALWDHSYRVAFYSYNLAKNFKRKKDLLDDAYVGGILHDIGKIIFSTVHPELLEKISRFCNEKELHHDILEELSAGLNHAMIGGMIAEKWNFPPSLISAIKFHHVPEQSPKEHKDVVNTVYLANAMSNLESGKITFDQINTKIMLDFGIQTEEQFMMIQQRLSGAFDSDSGAAGDY